MLLPIVLAACVTLGALLFVARPLFSESELRPAAPADALSTGRLKLFEERDRTLAALKELEFDHRTGKVSDVDYRESIGPLRRHAIETLRALDPIELPVRAARRRKARPRAKVRT
jgi:hypothetical protein